MNICGIFHDIVKVWVQIQASKNKACLELEEHLLLGGVRRGRRVGPCGALCRRRHEDDLDVHAGVEAAPLAAAAGGGLVGGCDSLKVVSQFHRVGGCVQGHPVAVVLLDLQGQVESARDGGAQCVQVDFVLT